MSVCDFCDHDDADCEAEFYERAQVGLAKTLDKVDAALKMAGHTGISMWGGEWARWMTSARKNKLNADEVGEALDQLGCIARESAKTARRYGNSGLLDNPVHKLVRDFLREMGQGDPNYAPPPPKPLPAEE